MYILWSLIKGSTINDLGGGVEENYFSGGGGGQALEQEGVENLIRVVPRCEREGVCFSRTHEREGVGVPVVQPHIPVLFRT